VVCETLIPAWSAGVTEQEVIVPPEWVGVWAEIATSLVAVRLELANARLGATALTVIVNFAEAAPPELEAVTV
jgi:hypothetical protein